MRKISSFFNRFRLSETQLPETLPCIVCLKKLEGISSVCREINQPNNGLAFESNGHYGSTFFDPMDGSSIEINLCDKCLKERGPVAIWTHSTSSK